jgi:hypothetical protein
LFHLLLLRMPLWKLQMLELKYYCNYWSSCCWHDKANSYVKERNARLIGPNCPGIITPGEELVSCQVLFSKKELGLFLNQEH